jgi:hypothetical protein
MISVNSPSFYSQSNELFAYRSNSKKDSTDSNKDKDKDKKDSLSSSFSFFSPDRTSKSDQDGSSSMLHSSDGSYSTQHSQLLETIQFAKIYCLVVVAEKQVWAGMKTNYFIM